MRSLNLDQLRTLIEVAALGNFSAAARRLNLTQPAVSLHIRELEHRFGVRLIERMGSRAYATSPGRELVERASRILVECDGADAAMRRFHDGWIGTVHIGTTLTALTYQLPPILKKLRREHPGIDLLVTNMPTRDSVENVMKNAIDLALVTLPVKAARLRVTPLRAESLVAIFPSGQADIPDEVTPDYVARQSLVLEHSRGAVHALVTQWLAKHLPLQRTPMHIGTVEAMKRIVASNLGMSIVPDVAVADSGPDLVVRPLKPRLPCTLALVEHRNKPRDLALDLVRAALLELKDLEADAAHASVDSGQDTTMAFPLARKSKSKSKARLHAL
ncbi:MAG: LysR family transcriptional regulator [Hyphomicrobiales bacterium]|nr:LysR family transcriptional regulator [Hyphomicrobiales bacterium]